MLGLAVIPYYYSINDLMNSQPINSDPWSHVIYVGLVYLVNHVFSTKFAIDIDLLSSYCVISNHPVTEFIMVMTFRFNFFPRTFIIMI